MADEQVYVICDHAGKSSWCATCRFGSPLLTHKSREAFSAHYFDPVRSLIYHRDCEFGHGSDRAEEDKSRLVLSD